VSSHLTVLFSTLFSLSSPLSHLSISSQFAINSQWWASLGEAVVDVEVTFHGISATPPLAPPVHIQSACPTPVHVNTPLRPETLSVSAKFSTLRKFYRPSKGGAVLRALGQERDLLPMGRQISELELTYSFEQSEKEAVKVCVALEMLLSFHVQRFCSRQPGLWLRVPPPVGYDPRKVWCRRWMMQRRRSDCELVWVQVTPKAQALYDVLYDSPFESQILMVFDSNKQLMGFCDGLHGWQAQKILSANALSFCLAHRAWLLTCSECRISIPLQNTT